MFKVALQCLLRVSLRLRKGSEVSDIYDQATDHEMRDRELALQNVRAIAGTMPTLTANGKCYNCAEVVGIGATFCDSDCRDDWQLRVNRNR